jgi:hypothetical protein
MLGGDSVDDAETGATYADVCWVGTRWMMWRQVWEVKERSARLRALKALLRLCSGYIKTGERVVRARLRALKALLRLC